MVAHLHGVDRQRRHALWGQPELGYRLAHIRGQIGRHPARRPPHTTSSVTASIRSRCGTGCFARDTSGGDGLHIGLGPEPHRHGGGVRPGDLHRHLGCGVVHQPGEGGRIHARPCRHRAALKRRHLHKRHPHQIRIGRRAGDVRCYWYYGTFFAIRSAIWAPRSLMLSAQALTSMTMLFLAVNARWHDQPCPPSSTRTIVRTPSLLLALLSDQ